jgi:hypothetical protein
MWHASDRLLLLLLCVIAAYSYVVCRLKVLLTAAKQVAKWLLCCRQLTKHDDVTCQ